MTEQLKIISFTLIFFAILLSLKHLICEYIVQPHNFESDKSRNSFINNLKHISHHALGTMVVGLILDFKAGLIIGLVLLESVLHYLIEWLHTKFDAKLSEDSRRYWQWLGVEQFLHYQTYIIMIILAKQYLIYYS